MKIENPTNLPTFNKIVDELSKLFNVDVSETRLNYYPDQNSWKCPHKDKNAYGNVRYTVKPVDTNWQMTVEHLTKVK